MNIRLEVRNAILMKFSAEEMESNKGVQMGGYRNHACRRATALSSWDPWCNYVQLYPKQLSVARLLTRYGKLPLRIEIKNCTLARDDDHLRYDTWSVIAIDRESSIVLACVTGVQPSPFSETLSTTETVYDEPRFLFNHLDGTKSRVSQLIEFMTTSRN